MKGPLTSDPAGSLSMRREAWGAKVKGPGTSARPRPAWGFDTVGAGFQGVQHHLMGSTRALGQCLLRLPGLGAKEAGA